MATYAIGDVQGCYATLRRLLRRFRFDAQKDHLWLVGDLVNRGPQSLEVLRWARDQGERVRMVLGNHDVHLLARAAGVSEPKKRDTLDDVLAAKDMPELVEWLARQPLLVRQGDWVMVHAGLLPGWSFDDAEQLAEEGSAALRGPSRKQVLRDIFAGSPERWDAKLARKERLQVIFSVFTRLRICTRDGAMKLDFSGAPDSIPEGYLPWFEAPSRREPKVTTIFGHWAALGLHVSPRYVALDTGCVWGKALTAMRLEDREIFQEPAHG